VVELLLHAPTATMAATMASTKRRRSILHLDDR
jgi:hypothetical protein